MNTSNDNTKPGSVKANKNAWKVKRLGGIAPKYSREEAATIEVNSAVIPITQKRKVLD